MVRIFINDILNGTIIAFPNPVNGKKLKLLFSNVEKGVYAVSLQDFFGRKLFTRIYKHDGVNVSKELILPYIMAGKYQIEIKGEQKLFLVPVIITNN